MSSLSKDQVRHVAALARLSLTDAEVSRLQAELGKILEHVAQLEALDTSGVPATEHLAVDRLPLQADEPRPGLSHGAALGPAPRTINDGFAVPGFVED